MKNADRQSSPGSQQRSQREILRHEHLLQTILDSLTHPFYVIDVTTFEVCVANRAAAEMQPADAPTCYALTHGSSTPCDLPDHPCPLRIIVETKRPAVVEHIHCGRQGERRNVEVHGFPIFDAAGEVTQIIEYCIDVTEHRRIQEQHRWELEVNKAIAALADALVEPVFSIEQAADIVLEQAQRLTGSAHGFVSSMNPDTRDMTSHTLTHMMEQCRVTPRRRNIIFHPGPDGRYPGLWGHALNTGEGFYTDTPTHHPASGGLPAGHIPLRNFLTVPALVGDEVVGQIALANSEKGYTKREFDASGRIATLYALAIRRWRSQKALKDSEERYALAQRAANIGSWDWNMATGSLLWSDRIEPMFGFGPGQFEGTYEAFLECLHPEDRQAVIDAVAACIERHEDYCIEHRIVQPDGTVRWVAETGNVFYDSNGNATRMVGVVQDITERKQAEIQVRDLAKFAAENPSPALRIRRDGKVLYSNRPGQALMKTWKTQPGHLLPENWGQRVAEILHDKVSRMVEVDVQGRTFSLVLVPVTGADYVNVYGRDVTEQKQAEHQIRQLNEELEQHVQERTTELTQANRQLREASRRRKHLERDILEISEREQRRIGGELHDSLGQQLTGIAIMTKVLEKNLQRQAVAEAGQAKEIGQLVNQAISETRDLSHGLHPVALDENGLMSALQTLAATTESRVGVSCVFRCETPVLVQHASTAVHLYRIAQEAVTNAIKHGKTRNIQIELAAGPRRGTLSVTNDGLDFPQTLPQNRGLGLQVMSYRAEMIGGTLDTRRGPAGGTQVTCTFRRRTERTTEGETTDGRQDARQDQIT